MRKRTRTTTTIVALILLACGESGDTGTGPPPAPNRPPERSGSVEAMTLMPGETATVNAQSYFRDPDGGALTYTAATSNPAVAAASVSGSTVTVSGVAPGTATITVTATDTGGLSAQLSFQVTVEEPNSAPIPQGGLPDGYVSADTMTVGLTISLPSYLFFTDPDGDPLTFSAASADTSVVAAWTESEDTTFVIEARAAGTARITFTATDPGGLSATLYSDMTVLGPQSDRDALMALYESAGGAEWLNADNWGTDAPLDEWYGVETDASGRVARLDLSGVWDSDAQQCVVHGLSGPIPPELGSLDGLRYLNLYCNLLTGEIPPELGWLDSLDSLYLRRNELSGPIPVELGDLYNLKVASLGANRLTGEIPSEIGNLESLTHLLLSSNELSGEIPSELGRLHSLELALLGANRLTGEIPPELGNLESLERLSLSRNLLTGEIPSELGNLESLTRLWLYSNELSGNIPPELGDLSSLEMLDLEDNRLSGGVPAELGEIGSSLEVLFLDDNDLTGEVPANWMSLDGLVYFFWDGNAEADPLCVPEGGDWDNWLGGIDNTEGPRCPGAAGSSINVRVRAGNDPLENVAVALTGEGESRSAQTNAIGQTLFSGLRAGRYTVSISGFDTNAVRFPGGTSTTVTVAANEQTTVSFDGQYVGSGVTGGLYYDEAPKDDALSTGEVFLVASGVSVTLEGPAVGQRRSTNTNPNGRFVFENLAPGTYALTVGDGASLPSGVAYGGPVTGVVVTVAAGQTATEHIPLDITHQTVVIGARLDNGTRQGPSLPNVTVALYSDAELNSELVRGTTAANGIAELTFERGRVSASDTADYTVYASAVNAHADLAALAGNASLPVRYRREPVTAAGHLPFVNQRAAFRFEVRAIDDPNGIGISGADRPFGNWDANVSSGGTRLGRTTDAQGAASVDDTGTEVPRTYRIELAATQSEAMGQDWRAAADGNAGMSHLEYVHDGLRPPGGVRDAGTLRVRFTTQRLVVGVHWERDHRPGYNPGVDLLPVSSASNLSIELLFVDANGRARRFEQTGVRNPVAATGGMGVFDRLPSDTRFTVETSAATGAGIKVLDPAYISTFSLDRADRGDYSRGGFGDLGGAYPEVQICPLRTSYNDHCSTAAYVWTNNIVSGIVQASNTAGISGMEVTLMPVAGSAIGAETMTVTSSTGGAGVSVGGFEFDDVPDGRYEIRVAGRGEWAQRPLNPHTFFRSRDFGTTGRWNPRPRMIYQNGSIAGFVVNDLLNSNQDRVNDGEAMTGIVVELHDNAAYSANPGTSPLMTATTDAQGRYRFAGLAEDTYLVKVPETEDYRAYHGSGAADSISAPLALAWPTVAVDSAAALPQWNYERSRVSDNERDGDFVWLSKRGVLSGTLTTAPPGSDLRAWLCQPGQTVATGNPAATYNCREASGADDEGETWWRTRTDSQGRWSFSGLREGYYLVRLIQSATNTVLGLGLIRNPDFEAGLSW